jgi:hypothetical protein
MQVIGSDIKYNSGIIKQEIVDAGLGVCPVEERYARRIKSYICGECYGWIFVRDRDFWIARTGMNPFPPDITSEFYDVWRDEVFSNTWRTGINQETYNYQIMSPRALSRFREVILHEANKSKEWRVGFLKMQGRRRLENWLNGKTTPQGIFLKIGRLDYVITKLEEIQEALAWLKKWGE